MHWLRNTAPDANGLTAQLLRRGGQPAVQWVHRAIIAAWRSGRAPAAWKRALLVPIHKKGSRLASDNYRGVTLLEICGKVYILVIHRRTYQHLSNQMLDCQQGFRPNRGTGDALFSLRRLEELARDFNTPLHAAFVDFRKAFDSSIARRFGSCCAPEASPPRWWTSLKTSTLAAGLRLWLTAIHRTGSLWPVGCARAAPCHPPCSMSSWTSLHA
jgi:hypothetical protein